MVAGGKPAVSVILCLLPSRVYYFSSYLKRKVAPSSRPQGGNVTLLLGERGERSFILKTNKMQLLSQIIVVCNQSATYEQFLKKNIRERKFDQNLLF